MYRGERRFLTFTTNAPMQPRANRQSSADGIHFSSGSLLFDKKKLIATTQISSSTYTRFHALVMTKRSRL
ncbi:hypothetical protein ACFX12_026312 [Malus domestica]